MKIGDILRNEIVQTIILAAIVMVGVTAFWFGLRFALGTDYPILAVASGSMEPTLYEGDLIIVQGVSDFSELRVGAYKFRNGTLNPNAGEAIIYYDPRQGRVPVYLPIAGVDAHLIVHRAVEKYQIENGTWYFHTKGDASSPGSSHDPWGPIRQDYIVGKVVGIVPWLGHVPLFMHRNRISAILMIALLFVAIIVVDFVFSKKGERN